MGERGSHRAIALACVWLLASLGCERAPARRVISLSQATTQVATALGLGDRLETIAPGPDALTRGLASGADLAISDAGAAAEGVRAAFASRGLAVRTFAPRSTTEVLAAYTEIATVLGSPKAAAELIERVTREMQALGKDGKHPRVALVSSRTPLRVVVGDAYASHLLGLSGVTNVFEKETGVVIPIQPEQLRMQNAEKVVDVPDAALAGAWIDPVGTATALRRSLAE